VAVTAAPPLPHVACDDCERIRPGLVAQPVNTASSVALCLAGAALLHRRAHRPGRVLGVLAIAAGLGSVAYHGPGGRPSRVAHDASAVALAAGVVATLVVNPPRLARRVTSAGLFAAGVAVHRASRTGRLLCRPDSVLQGHALWHVLTAAAVVAVVEP
jgi:drug/metabolite transporter (DMT)-like permease